MTDLIRILHVDSDSKFKEMTAKFLEQESDHFNIIGESHGTDTRERVMDRNEEIDCVISDYALTDMNGVELLEAIRDEFPNLPFILFTGKGSEAVARDALRAGATDYLQKQSGTEQYDLLANRVKNAVGQFRADQRVTELERVRTLVADINQVLVHGTSKCGIETDVCELFAESEPYVSACIAGVDTDTMRIEPRTWAGADQAYFEQLDMVVTADASGHQAPGGRAYHDREVAVSQDITNDPQYEPWRDAALERGFESLAVVPLEYNAELYGLLAIFASRPRTFMETERRLLTEIGNNIAYALHNQVVETELERTTREFRTLFDHIPAGTILVDHDDGTFRYRQFNPRMEELSGLSDDEIRNKTPQEALGMDDGEVVETRYQECVERGEPVEYIHEFEIAGEQVVRNVTAVPVRDGKHIEHLVIFVQDVTERVLRERKLGESEARYRALAENFPNGGVFLFDEELRYQIVSGSGFGPIDTDPKDLVGNTIYQVEPYSEETIETLKPIMESTLAGDKETVELTYENHVYNLQTAPIRDDEGEVIGGLYITQDITEQRELQWQNDRLEEFASVVSHDLRNPLNIIDGRLELAKGDCDSEHLVEAEAALDRCQTLVDDLLTLAREGQRVAETETVRLADILDECWTTIEPDEATLNHDIDWTILADRGRLKQLLENLFYNTIDHAGPAVTVEVGRLDDGFYVADDGPGIPDDIRDEVFQSGYSTGEDNTGFGLAIVKEIIDAHGWDITVEESASTGTRFEVTDVETP